MTTSAAQIRAWRGPAILGFGFRPFFLFASLWAAIAMALWVMMLSGHGLPTGPFDPVSWHAHELLFGYLGAVIAGFLLTAVPNWTGRLPIVGWRLGGLVALWAIGRIAVLLPWPPVAVAVLDLAFPAAFAAVIGREVITGKNWRNLPVLALLLLFTLANGLFHLEAARGDLAARGVGLRLALATAILLMSLIGGRIVPSFTRNWLAQRHGGTLPVPFNGYDKIALAVTGAALAVWLIWPQARGTALICLLAGLLQSIRLARWCGHRTTAEALVWVLHVGYAFVPLGFFAIAAGHLRPALAGTVQHVWMAGAIGLMTLAVMTRASLGHGGRPLHATRPITALYVALIVAVGARLVAGLIPEAPWLLHLAATAWMAAYGGFAVIYWPILTRHRRRP